MPQNPRTIAAAIVVLALLIVSTLGAFALEGSGTSHANGSAPAISAGLTMAVGPTCTATVSGENSQHTAIQRVIVTYSSTPGAVICISPGTYPEQLTINGTTDLTLWGSGNTSTILSPPSVVVNQVDLDSGLATYAILGAFDDSGLTMANLAINGTSSASSAVGCAAFNGIYFANSSGTIENTTITGINQNDGCQGQNAVVVNNGYFTTQSAVALSVSIRDNTVLGYGKNGITCNDPGVDCAIAGNTVATTAMASGFSATNGIQLYGANGTILNNSVSGNDYLPSWCAGGNYFFAGSGPCSGNSLAQATGILLYAPGNGVNVSGNSLTGNQIGVADIGGPMSAWHNTVRSAGFYGMVLDFNATPGWLGSAVYASGPYTGTVGDNAVRNSNVGVLVYDDNASLLSNVLSNVNVSFEVATDLPVGYSVQLQDNNATSNVSGALLGDVSSFQPGVASYPVGNFTLLGNAFVNGSTSPAGGHHVFGALAYAKKAALLDNQLVHFSTGVQVILPPNGNLSASQNRLSAPVSPPDAGGVGFYAFAGNASFTNNTVTDWSWMNGPGWWPNSQDAGVFLQCLQNCSVRNNSVSNSAIGIAVISYVYGPSPAPSWPFAAPASQGPIILTGNHVSGSGAFGIALELSRGNTPNAALATTVIANNWIDSRSTGAVGLMTDEGSYNIDHNVFTGTTLTGSSGASQPTGIGSIGTAAIQVLNAYDYITQASLQGNVFLDTTASLAVLNITSGGGFASASYGENITVAETGLPVSTPWYLNVSGAPNVGLDTPGFFLDLQNGSYAYTAQDANAFYHAVTPSGTISVVGAPITLTVPFVLTTYEATFTEAGLPAGTNWSITIGASTFYSVTTTISDALTNGTYAYSIAPIVHYAVTGSRAGSFSINGAGYSRSVVWTLVTYAVDFTESGLASGTSWQVTLGAQSGSSTNTMVDFQATNGTYAYSITPISGYTTTWSGSVVVNGGSVNVSVTFTVVTYTVDFQESGLAAGTNWQVTVDSMSSSSTGTQIGFALPNGTFAYQIGLVSGYARTGTGTVMVNGAGANVPVQFVASVYTLTFAAVNLPSGTTWSVTVDAVTHSSNTRHITFTVANGTYNYSMGYLAGFHVVGGNSGTTFVTGGPLKVIVHFAVTKYKITFTETGLPGGSTWQVRLNGHTISTSLNKIQFLFKNGTYSFLVKGPVGYTPAPSSGTIVVNGASQTQAITFS